MRKILIMIIGLGLLLSSSTNRANENVNDMNNPFFREWTTPFGVPPFDEISEEHYVPAIKEGIKRQEAEMNSIADNEGCPTICGSQLFGPLDRFELIFKRRAEKSSVPPGTLLLASRGGVQVYSK